MSKINKAADYNKLLEQQANGKLLKKILQYPLMAQIKYDGNYTVTEVIDGEVYHTTSGGLRYRSTDNASDSFKNAIEGFYLAERIACRGILGDRVRCTLRGPKADQTSTGHNYKVFGYLTHKEYNQGRAEIPRELMDCGLPDHMIVTNKVIYNKQELDDYLKEVVSLGYEGLMLYQPDFIWKDTKSRTISLCKYKKRRTADLRCIGTNDGEGKYVGLIGSLSLQDNDGRIVSVGSGLSDWDRNRLPSEFVGKVIEIEFEQIIDTYIQPTFITIRDKEEID